MDEEDQLPLNAALAAWRQGLAQRGLREDELAELESHLRDAFEDRVAAGMPPGAAWKSAVEALGSDERIAREFYKFDGLRRRPPALWAIAAVFLLVGHSALWSVWSSAWRGEIQLHASLVALLIGPGLLLRWPLARHSALLFVWFVWAAMLWLAIAMQLAPAGKFQVTLQFFGCQYRCHGDDYWTIVVPMCAAGAAGAIWVHRILTRTDVRRLFAPRSAPVPASGGSPFA